MTEFISGLYSSPLTPALLLLVGFVFGYRYALERGRKKELHDLGEQLCKKLVAIKSKDTLPTHLPTNSEFKIFSNYLSPKRRKEFNQHVLQFNKIMTRIKSNPEVDGQHFISSEDYEVLDKVIGAFIRFMKKINKT
ncbi:MAG: hypothetical protein FWD70_05410 [Desulfuromonadales bacterium]|nr:hypothetical protein [Desulfuromonadales bacterium]